PGGCQGLFPSLNRSQNRAFAKHDRATNRKRRKGRYQGTHLVATETKTTYSLIYQRTSVPWAFDNTVKILNQVSLAPLAQIRYTFSSGTAIMPKTGSIFDIGDGILSLGSFITHPTHPAPEGWEEQASSTSPILRHYHQWLGQLP